MVAGVRHGNSHVVGRVSPGRINVVLLIEQNMLFLVNLNPEFLS